MAGKTTAKSPRSTPKSASKPRPEAVANPVTSANADGEDSKTEAATEPESLTVTPARRSSKRKAAEDAAPATSHQEKDGETTTTTPSSKKPRVYAHEAVSVTESAGRKHTHRTVKVEIPLSTPTNNTKPAGKHIVFDNDNEEEGHSEFFTPQEIPAGKSLDALLPKGGEEEKEEEEDNDDEDESDSDDDAPEAVSTQAAAANAAKSADAATKAAEKQEEQQKRKRQERDARLKEQAEVRKRQQQKAEQKQRRKDKKAAAHAAAESGGDSEDGDGDEAKPEQQQQQQGQQQPRRDHIASLTSSAPTRRRLDKRSLPAVLPDDFLDLASDDDEVPGGDDEEEEDDEAARERAAKRRRSAFKTASRKVARAETRQPLDQRVGATVYRVMREQGDDRLAPRAAKYSRNAKEALLGRGRPAARKAGFVVKKR